MDEALSNKSRFFIFVVTFFLLLEYEQNYRESYKYIFSVLSMIMYFGGYALGVLSVKTENFIFVKFISLFLLYSLVSFSFGNVYLPSLLRAAIFFIIFFAYRSLFYNALEFNYFLRAFVSLVSICAVLSVLIYFFSGFFIWDYTQIGRVSSIFHDPNYAGILFSLAMVFLLFGFVKYNFHLSVCLFVILLVALFLTFSKTAFLFFGFSIGLYFLTRSMLYIPIYGVIGIFVYYNFYEITYWIETIFPSLRFSHGLNGRGVFFDLAVSLISESPFDLHDSYYIKDSILAYTFRNNVSFHNTYLDLAYVYGLQFAVLPFLYALIVSVYGFFNYDIRYAIVSVGLFLASFTLFYFPAGSDMLSFMMAIFLVRVERGSNVKAYSC